MARGVGHFNSAAGRERFLAAYARALDGLPAEREQRLVDTRFGSVSVQAFGKPSGPALVLLPGRSATAAMWAPNAAGLAEHFAVYAVDSLGEPGGSIQLVPLRGAADQAAWLDETLAGLGLGSTHLVGASIGGWLAFNQALRAPARVASVSLLDPANVFARFSTRMMLAATAASPAAPRVLRRRFFDFLSGEPVPSGDPIAELISTAMDTYRLAQQAPAYPTDDDLRSVRRPVLALLGGRSNLYDVGKAERRARSLLSAAEVEVLPRASHALPSDDPEAVNARVIAFVNRVEQGFDGRPR